jgi:mono/diheme cytochrome c family protein
MTKWFFCAGAVALLVVIGCAQNGLPADGAAEAKPAAPGAGPPSSGIVASGRALFLKNCAHCHGADARGDDGPDLHGLGLTDEEIAGRIRKGKRGQMTAFAGKLQPAEIDALVAYVETLK